MLNKLVDEIDLGTLNWANTGSIFRTVFNTQMPASSRNGLISKYIGATSWSNFSSTDKSWLRSSDSNLYINDSSYTDSTTFKNSLNGVIFNYELATPTQTIIASNLHLDEISSLIQDGGTIEMINSGTPTNTTTTFIVKKAVGE